MKDKRFEFKNDLIALKPLTENDFHFLDSILNYESVFKKEEINRIKNFPQDCWMIKNDTMNVGAIWFGNENIAQENVVSVLLYIHPNYVRKGYGFKALEFIVKHSFENLKLNKLLAIIHRLNNPSLKLFEKVGFNRIDNQGLLDIYEIKNT